MPASDLGPSELQDEGLGGWEPVKLTYKHSPGSQVPWILILLA